MTTYLATVTVVIFCVGFPTELTRKHISEMFFIAEIESEARNSIEKLQKWKFKRNDDIELYMQEVISEARFCLFPHVQSQRCPEIGKYLHDNESILQHKFVYTSGIILILL